MKRFSRIASACTLGALGACSSDKSAAKPRADSAVQTAAVIPHPGTATCPSDGKWAQCSVLYRLDRAGTAPKLDTAAKVEEKALHGQSFVVKIGLIAKLEVFLYPDSTARIADEKNLDRSQFVDDIAPQTIKRERTLIESVNMVALLTSLNERQRERVGDALGAGPPQPNSGGQ